MNNDVRMNVPTLTSSVKAQLLKKIKSRQCQMLLTFFFSLLFVHANLKVKQLRLRLHVNIVNMGLEVLYVCCFLNVFWIVPLFYLWLFHRIKFRAVLYIMSFLVGSGVNYFGKKIDNWFYALKAISVKLKQSSAKTNLLNPLNFDNSNKPVRKPMRKPIDLDIHIPTCNFDALGIPSKHIHATATQRKRIENWDFVVE